MIHLSCKSFECLRYCEDDDVSLCLDRRAEMILSARIQLLTTSSFYAC